MASIRLTTSGRATLLVVLAVAAGCAQRGPVKAGSGGNSGSGGGNGSGGNSSGSGGNASGSGGDSNGSGGNSSGSGGNSSGSGGDSNGSGGSSSGSGGCSSGSGGNSSGSGGDSSGSGGSDGSGGSAPNTCTVPSGNVTSCASAFAPPMPLLTDFSSATWMNTAGKWGLCGNLMGATQGYAGAMTSDAGVMTSLTATVDTATEAFKLTGSVAAGDYAGGILAFAQCANVSAYKGLQFKLDGSAAGCDLYVQLQTLSQQSSKYGGGCDEAMGICFQFPKVKVPFAAGAATVQFADFASTGMPAAAADFEKEMIGIQWQFQPPAAATGEVQPDCASMMVTIDDVTFVM